jgi:hypothetical protein
MYEAVSQCKAFASADEAYACAQGAACYPWELPFEQQALAWQRSRLRSVVAPCLERDAVARPSAQQVFEVAAKIGVSSTAADLGV